MREIQDMTINVARGLERLERRLAELSERFSQEFERLETPEEAAGIRLTATPVGDEIRLVRVFRNHGIADGLEEPWHTVKHRQGYNERSLTPPMTLPYTWRPMLRSARAEFLPNIRFNLPRIVYKELHCDGSTEIGIIAGLVDFNNELDLYLESSDVLVSFANLIAQADRIRNYAGFPVAEYAVEIEINVSGRTTTVTMDGFQSLGKLEPGSMTFPRYSVGGPDEFPRLLNMFYRDFLNHMGADTRDEESSFKMPGWPSQD